MKSSGVTVVFLHVMTSSVIYYSKEQKVQHEMKLSGVTVVLYTL